MPPKKAPAATGSSTESHMQALITVLATSDVKIDTNLLAPILGISAAKNVYVADQPPSSYSDTPCSPRKLNSIVNPYGYEYKGGSFVKQNSAGNAKAAKAGDEDQETKAEVKPQAAGENIGATKTTKKKPAAKKRKLEDSDEDGDEIKKEESEAGDSS